MAPAAGGGAGWSSPRDPTQTAGPKSGRAPPAFTAPHSGASTTINGRQGPNEIEGQARGIVSRADGQGESGGETVWTFRVERYDDVGNRELLLPVEMRGYRFEGSIAEGDWVRLRGRMKRGTLEASEVENVTTGATIRAKTTPRMVGIVFAVIFGVAFVAVVVTIIVTIVKVG